MASVREYLPSLVHNQRIVSFDNDTHRSSTLLSFILFADDTNIFNSHSDINTLITTTNEELKKVAEWLRANKLSLNIKKKTQFIIFKARNKKAIHPVKIKIDGTEVRQVESVKFLGIYIDANRDWKQHIRHICNKISKTTGLLCKARHYVPPEYLKVFIIPWYIHTFLFTLVLKSPDGEWPITYKFTFTFIMVIFAGEVHIPRD